MKFGILDEVPPRNNLKSGLRVRRWLPASLGHNRPGYGPDRLGGCLGTRLGRLGAQLTFLFFVFKGSPRHHRR